MAKQKRKTAPAAGADRKTRQARPAAPKKARKQPEESGGPREFLRALGSGLKAAGEAAGRYTRIGVKMAEIEKLRMDLRSAYGRLGEQVAKTWDKNAEAAVTPQEPGIKTAYNAVADLRQRIDGAQAEVRGLK